MAPPDDTSDEKVKDMLRRKAGVVDEETAEDLERWFGSGNKAKASSAVKPGAASRSAAAAPLAPPTPSADAGSVDVTSAEDLERWFSMPSFQELAENPDAGGAEVAAEIRETRDRATASIRPEFLSAMLERNAPPEAYFKPELEPYDASIALFDESMLERGIAISNETRELEVPEALVNDMDENTPQALLRDLHRVVSHFELALEIVDYGAMQRLDVVEAVKVAMSTSWRLPPLDRTPAAACQVIIDEYRAVRRISWAALHVAKVEEDMSAWEKAGAE